MSGTEMYLYGSAIDDDILLRDPKYLPRYGHLARKVLMHYAGDLYNPHVHGLMHEPFLRALIKDIIAFKIFHRTEYDWEWLDNAFRRYVNGCFGTNLPYDAERLKAGLSPEAEPKIFEASSAIN
jgi:hypothetical protein